MEPREGEDCLRTEDILDVISREGDEVRPRLESMPLLTHTVMAGQIALVWFAGVQYYSGQVFEMQKITAAAKAKVRPSTADAEDTAHPTFGV